MVTAASIVRVHSAAADSQDSLCLESGDQLGLIMEETSDREELVLRGQDRGEPASCSQHGGVSSMWCWVGAGGSL